LHISRRRDRPNITANLVFRQSDKHSDYLHNLKNLFKDYCSNTPILKTESKNNTYITLQFATKVSPYFNYFHDLFYINGKKVVPYGVEHLKTPRALAHWFKDDGTTDRYKGGIVGFVFCTDSFTWADVLYLGYILKIKFNIITNVHKSSSGPR
jgi:hypothetical protein